HQVDGICFLIFAERGLWNRFVPSLDGYIQDRLNNPVHVPGHGTIKALRLEAPPVELVQRIVAARLRPALEELPDFTELPAHFPFADEQVYRIARTEPTLRDMLQQFRHLYDRLVYGSSNGDAETRRHGDAATADSRPGIADESVSIKSVVLVSTPAEPAAQPVAESASVPASPRPRVPASLSAAQRASLAEQ